MIYWHNITNALDSVGICLVSIGKNAVKAPYGNLTQRRRLSASAASRYWGTSRRRSPPDLPSANVPFYLSPTICYFPSIQHAAI